MREVRRVAVKHMPHLQRYVPGALVVKNDRMASGQFDAIVIGAGHNGLVTAAYLQRGGMQTLLLEARSVVGGTASSEEFGGATVNICNCDHLTFRTTPVITIRWKRPWMNQPSYPSPSASTSKRKVGSFREAWTRIH